MRRARHQKNTKAAVVALDMQAIDLKEETGAVAEIRTLDLSLTKDALYH
jgi:hypothetical protein